MRQFWVLTHFKRETVDRGAVAHRAAAIMSKLQFCPA